jgi:hypothetical protein
MSKIENTYLLCTPILELEGGNKCGGPIYIKTGSIMTYVGFATEALAAEFCAQWNPDLEVDIILASELGVNYPIDMPEIQKIVRFPDAQTLQAYMEDNQAFPYERYFVKV